MPQPIHPIDLMVAPRGAEGYKSISTLAWKEIPGLAVLTGRNGAGKTQLLELLAHHFTNTTPHWLRSQADLPVTVKITGDAYAVSEVGFVPSAGRFSGGPEVSLASIPDLRLQALQHGRNIHSYKHDVANMARAHRINRLLAGRNPEQLTPEELNEIFPSDFSLMLADVDVTQGLSQVFVAHRLKILESLERETPGVDEAGKELGPAPWDVLNDSLSVAEFPYEVVSPTETKLLDPYVLRLKDRKSGVIIKATDLSSGEQVLLQLVLWLYSSNKDGRFPRLLLLDEPDAHLHPSMTVQFLDVISEVLVKKHGVRVIMTTHSPSTVALAPEGSVFQMERGAQSIDRITNIPAMVAVLTSGLVTVSRATKFCFVEDEADVDFYEALREILTDYGPSKDPNALSPAPTLAFIAASVGSGSTKVSGGASVVAKWVEKLDAEPLTTTFFGLTDRDKNNTPTPRVHVIGRYSIENYLLDPLNIFGLLLENGSHPSIPGFTITSGNEHELRQQSEPILQRIADEITSRMEAAEPGLKTGTSSVAHYTTGQRVTVPSWVIDHRGHDLLPVAQRAFGGAGLVSPPRLVRALRRTRLVPSELAAVLATIQGA